MRIARVFPRKTNATPTDDLVYFNGPGMFPLEVDEVHISVAFTYDLKTARYLEKQWKHVAPVIFGGPAFNEQGGEFIPGRYIKEGYVITSRGCPNNCWFCKVPDREGRAIRELEVKEGNNLLDDNLLACSDEHIKKVFEMLKRQTYGQPVFTGGLEAAKLKPWHVKELREIKPKEMFFAYDTPDDLEPLVEAGKLLREAGFTVASHTLNAYVLIGYQEKYHKDTFEKAEQRLMDTMKAGFMPFAMLYKDDSGKENEEWRRFQRLWSRPAIIASRFPEYLKSKKEVQNETIQV
jgi:hypothetical protein